MRMRQDVGGEGVADSRRRRVALALIIGTFMAGCSDADGDEPLPTTTAAESRPVSTATAEPPTTPAPGPTPWPEPTRPAAMERDDIEGAKAAAEHFLALYAYIFATGDLDEWRAMSHRDCQFCGGAADRVTELFDEGGYAIGGEFVVTGVDAVDLDGDNAAYRIGLTGIEAPSKEYSAIGSEIREIDGGSARYSFAVMREVGQWVVVGGSVEAVDER